MKITEEKLKNPPKKYRPMPFWSWNTALDMNETAFQVDQMDNCGMGGFFMHARGGLKTPYMKEEWFNNVKASIKQAGKSGMLPWGYDENGWPSGFGDNAVNGKGLDYQQKTLKMELTPKEVITPYTVCNVQTPEGKNAHIYYEVNELYVDNLNPKVTDAFIQSTHEKYKEVLGDSFWKMAGFFTDEPQMSRNGIPWSSVLPEEYKKEYGEELIPKLYDMFCDTDTCYETRFRFWKLVTKMFSQNYSKKLYDWCNANNMCLTGHMLAEDFMKSQVNGNGACMPHFEYFHIPGVDRLSRWVEHNVAVIQASSVAHQLGKKQVLTESYAMAGWDASFEELKWLLEWQMVKGVNLLCQHLAGYSLEGLRKRDYPGGHFYQNPWWESYKDFNDFAGRMGMLLSEGQIRCDVLVLQPMATAWAVRSGEDYRSKIAVYDERLLEVLNTLDENQVIYHLGDDTIMQRHGTVSGKKLNVGEMSYSTVIVPESLVLDSNTYRLIKQFYDNGGNLIFVGNVPKFIDGVRSGEISPIVKSHAESVKQLVSLIPKSHKYCTVTDNDGNTPNLQYTYRAFCDFEMHYFVNSHSGECKDTNLSFKGKSAAVFDYLSGQVVPTEYTQCDGVVTVKHTFCEKGSLVLFSYDDERYKSVTKVQTNGVCINNALLGEWEIAEHDPNVLTLDYCDVYFDGQLVGESIYVNDIQEMANALRRKVNVRLVFDICLKNELCNELYLVVEQPDKLMLSIKGKECQKKKCGYYRDKSFIKLDISGKLTQGHNKIQLEYDFVQSGQVYCAIDDCDKFETAKNKLWYDMEIEPVYLLGDFSVYFDEEFTNAHDDCVTNSGKITVDKLSEKVYDGDLTQQGFAFFCGHIKLKKHITLDKTQIKGAYILLSRRCSALSSFTVNGKSFGNMYWAPYRVDIGDALKLGDNVIELDITGNFRNMLGPHHAQNEECYVGPNSFMHKSEIFGSAKNWSDSYTFAKYGLFLG